MQFIGVNPRDSCFGESEATNFFLDKDEGRWCGGNKHIICC